MTESLARQNREKESKFLQSPLELFPSRQLLQAVKTVKTLTGIPIYENTQIEIITADPLNLYPIALYVLAENLNWFRRVHPELTSFGYDIFNLDATISFMLKKTESLTVISPPIVEWSDADRVPLIIDGLHRAFLATQEKRLLSCVYVKGIDPMLVPISLPVLWGQVKIFAEPPGNPIERRILRSGITIHSPEVKERFRDFSLLGGSGRRPME